MTYRTASVGVGKRSLLNADDCQLRSCRSRHGPSLDTASLCRLTKSDPAVVRGGRLRDGSRRGPSARPRDPYIHLELQDRNGYSTARANRTGFGSGSDAGSPRRAQSGALERSPRQAPSAAVQDSARQTSRGARRSRGRPFHEAPARGRRHRRTRLGVRDPHCRKNRR